MGPTIGIHALDQRRGRAPRDTSLGALSLSVDALATWPLPWTRVLPCPALFFLAPLPALGSPVGSREGDEGGESLSNLGDYQTIVVLIKRLGGPAAAKKYLAAGAAGLVVAGGYAHKGIQTAGPMVRNWLDSLKRPDELSVASYVVRSAGTDEQGLELVADDVFHILERDNDAVLIEIVGRDDNPWVVSAKFLEQVSDFPSSEDPTGEGS